MKRFSRRAAALALSLLLALSLVTPALAAGASAYTVTTQLCDNLTLTQLNSRSGSTRRQQFTLEYQPDGSASPLVLYGDFTENPPWNRWCSTPRIRATTCWPR